MTYEEMIVAINASDPINAIVTATAALAQYTGEDKELIEPDVLEMAILHAAESVEV